MGDSMKPQHGGEGSTSGQEASLHPASNRRRRSIVPIIYFDGEQNGEKLQEALCSYTTETLDCIHTVRGLPGWIHERKGELNKIKAIKNRADKLQENLNPFELMDRTRRQAVLREEQELALVLEDTLKGLEKLGCFLDAVKKLAVTSPRVFMQEKHVVIHLPAGVSLELVQEVIQAARLICPILFTYEQEAGDSFLPKLQNLEVILQQLDEYIQTVQMIYDILEIRYVALIIMLLAHYGVKLFK
uniref:uncharacterized protein n=1 Tax=Semicossyphus pulcher TaxID=241346 RepID=UPI0037E74B18